METHRTDSAVRTLVDLFELTEKRATNPFFAYLDDLDQPPAESLTYGEFYQRARTVAANLQQQGIDRGDRVALVALPRADYVVMLAGVVLAGAVPAPINHHFKARELGAYLSVLSPFAVVTDGHTADIAAEALAQLDRAPLVIGISGHSADDLDVFDVNSGARYLRPSLAPDDPALILHSSGTTGFPKAVVRTHSTVADFVNWFAGYFDDDEHVLNFLPFYHQAGLILTFLTACRIGCDFVQQSRYSTSAFWELVDRYRATHMNLMAPVPTYLLAAPASPEDRAHSLRWVVIAGRNDHWADFQDRFGVIGMTFYGSTETLQITSTGSPRGGPVPRETLMSVGHGILTGRTIGDLTEFRLVDELGATIAEPHRDGRIEARGQFMFTEYLHNEEATREAFTSDGWFRTGDLGYTTDDGQLVLLGRGGGMIRRSGENIAPREIEMLLEDHPGIQDAIVIGVPDEFRGQEILARVVPVDGERLTPSEVFDYLESRLSAFKVPRYLVFHDSFERTPTFKIRVDRYQGRLAGETWYDRTAVQGSTR